MSNHVNYRRVVRRDSRFVAHHGLWKSTRHGHRWDRHQWILVIRRDSRRVTEEWEPRVIASKRPWLD